MLPFIGESVFILLEATSLLSSNICSVVLVIETLPLWELSATYIMMGWLTEVHVRRFNNLTPYTKQ